MMSTTRLKTVYKQEQNSRKYVCVMNDLAKTKQDLYDSYLDKEKQESSQKCNKSIVITRRNVVRQRVLKKCMKTTREVIEKQQMDDKYGRYNGICVEQIAENIDTYLEQDHPKLRRQRELGQLFDRGYARGTLLDDETAREKVQEYFQKPLFEIRTGKKQETVNKRERTTFLPPLASGFYTGDVANDWNNMNSKNPVERQFNDPLFVHRKVSKFLDEDLPDNLSIQSEVKASNSIKLTTKLRPGTLPPLKVGTDKSSFDGKQKPDCIADLIARLNRAKDKREKDSKERKEKRAKRLQAERVHGYTHTFHEPTAEQVKGNTLVIEGRGPK